MNKWWTTNVGEAPSTDWRLYYLPVEVFMNTVTAGEGERPAFGIKSAAGLGCLFIIRDVVGFVDMSVMRESVLFGAVLRYFFIFK